MAGSYNHIVRDDGNFEADPFTLSNILETDGDVFECVQELYGMIWYLANKSVPNGYHEIVNKNVAEAREHYQKGLEIAKEVNKNS